MKSLEKWSGLGFARLPPNANHIYVDRKIGFNGNREQDIEFLYEYKHYIISFFTFVWIIWLVDWSTFFRHAQTSYWVRICFTTTTLIHDALQKYLAFRKYVCKDRKFCIKISSDLCQNARLLITHKFLYTIGAVMLLPDNDICQ